MNPAATTPSTAMSVLTPKWVSPISVYVVRPRARVETIDADLAAVGAQQRRQHLDSRGLSRAVRTEESEDLQPEGKRRPPPSA